MAPRRPLLGAITPHHDVAAPLMEELYARLAEQLPSPERILLISPDHFRRGWSPITLRGAPWDDAAWGSLPADGAGAGALLRAGAARRQDDIFTGEHGITEHIPRIRSAFGQVPILPVMVRGEATDLQILAAARAMVPLLERGGLVLLSMDFSHYKPAAEARREDGRSMETIGGFQFNRLNGLDVDSVRGLRLFLLIMRLTGCTKSAVLGTGNSDDFMAPSSRTTGYATMIFSGR
ncbi:AmmeMemoRadiSam system protein B [Aminivibrio sp.]|uniref:AmmeMemoRadiSam system protein B n=1 Tax=Aminivibrio sp. TaxID=1872489 RepID=UPI00345E5595